MIYQFFAAKLPNYQSQRFSTGCDQCSFRFHAFRARCITMHHDASGCIMMHMLRYMWQSSYITFLGPRSSPAALYDSSVRQRVPQLYVDMIYIYIIKKNWRQETRILKRKAPSRAPITTHRKQGWPFPNPIKGRGRTPAVLLRLAWQTMGTWQHLPICGRTTRMTLRRFVVSSL